MFYFLHATPLRHYSRKEYSTEKKIHGSATCLCLGMLYDVHSTFILTLAMSLATNGETLNKEEMLEKITMHGCINEDKQPHQI